MIRPLRVDRHSAASSAHGARQHLCLALVSISTTGRLPLGPSPNLLTSTGSPVASAGGGCGGSRTAGGANKRCSPAPASSQALEPTTAPAPELPMTPAQLAGTATGRGPLSALSTTIDGARCARSSPASATGVEMTRPWHGLDTSGLPRTASIWPHFFLAELASRSSGD